MEQRRRFSAGSAPAPDEHDQYLEIRGFYRKHTARDATCLFRVISEQVFDIQLYHEKVRSDCVAYMRKHRKYYEKNFKRQRFDEYLNDMEDVKAYGGKLELEAMGHMYKRNIIIFEPYNKGKWFLRNEKYNAAPCLNVFYLSEGSHRRSPDHFDSVFKRDYVEKAAMCQSLIYEILYTKVYQLPDIMLAVELMLHDPTALHYVSIPPKRDGERVVEKAISDDGREFVLDTADKTNCVLDDDSLCHFHNKHNFTEIVRYETGSFGSYDPMYDFYERQRPRYSSMLPDFNKSCVRQLLEQGITPFPFKVAKTLDPFMYRNIEFDVWNDFRRSQRTRTWFYSMDLRVGSKCLANVDGNNYHGYIQDMAPQDGPCTVFVEELGEKVSVPYEALKTLPEELKPWTPAAQRRNSEYYGSGGDYYQQKYRSSRRHFPFGKSFESIIMDGEKPNRLMYPQMSSVTYKTSSTTSSEVALKQYTSTRHFQPPPYEQYAMPLVFGANVKNAKPLMEATANGTGGDKNDKSGKNNANSHNNNNQEANSEGKDKQQQSVNAQQQQQLTPLMEVPTFSTPMMYNGGGASFMYPAYGYPATPGCEQPFYYEQSGMFNGTCYFANQTPVQSPNMGAVPGFYTVPPPPPPPNMQPSFGYAVPAPAVAASPAFVAQPMVPARTTGKEVINYSAGSSVAVNGADLPLHDLPTLRYFYNLGIEYHRNYQGRDMAGNEIEPASQASEIAQLNSDVQALKIKIEDTTQTTSTETLTPSSAHNTSPLVKSDSFGGFPQNRENGGYNGNGNYRGNYGPGRRGGGYNRGGNRRGGYDNRSQNYKNSNGRNNNNSNNSSNYSNGNNGGSNHNMNSNSNNNQSEKYGGGRAAADTSTTSTTTLLSNTNSTSSTNTLSPNTQSSSESSSDFSQVPYQPLYMQPFYSSGPYYAAPEAAGEQQQQFFQYVQPAQPPHYSAVGPGMAPTAVYVPQSEMIMSPIDNNCPLNSSGEPVLSTGPAAPTFGYMNYPPIIYGPPAAAAPPPFMQPARSANNGYVWCPTTSAMGQQPAQQQAAAGNGFNSSGNISQ